MAHVPGSLYPVGGAPWLPTMCVHRGSTRSDHYARTILCYAVGLYEAISPTTGAPIEMNTAEGNFPIRLCERHGKAWIARYAPAPDGRRVTLRKVANVS